MSRAGDHRSSSPRGVIHPPTRGATPEKARPTPCTLLAGRGATTGRRGTAPRGLLHLQQSAETCRDESVYRETFPRAPLPARNPTVLCEPWSVGHAPGSSSSSPAVNIAEEAVIPPPAPSMSAPGARGSGTHPPVLSSLFFSRPPDPVFSVEFVPAPAARTECQDRPTASWARSRVWAILIRGILSQPTGQIHRGRQGKPVRRLALGTHLHGKGGGTA